MNEPVPVSGNHELALAAKEERASKMIELAADQFARVLPSHVGRDMFARWALTTLNRGLMDEKAAEHWRKVIDHAPGRRSMLEAFMDCAMLGLTPGREYHLVPFGGMVTGMIDYKGEIKLMTNAQRCVPVAQLVYASDIFHKIGANVPPRHEASPDVGEFGDRGPVVGGYAYVDFGGQLYSLVVTMSETEFERRIAIAKTRGGARIEEQWPEQWRLKTLLHQVRKTVPWSAEWRNNGH